MGAFSIKKKLYGDSKNIPSIAEQIRKEFVTDGCEVRIDEPTLDKKSISLRVDYLKLPSVFARP